MSYFIKDILVETEANPLGIDIRNPLISWKFSSEEKGMVQKAYQLTVKDSSFGKIVWDTGKVESDESAGVVYSGEELAAETKYIISLTTWNQNDEKATAESSFETGLLECEENWNGAQFIGAPEYFLSAESLSVFEITSTIKVDNGAAGIVFGAQDERLMDMAKNELGVAGDNHIRYVINAKNSPVSLEIYRVGYCKEDEYDKPLAVIELEDFDTSNEHKLTVQVTGNKAYAYVDDVKVDEVESQAWFGTVKSARQLNPLANNDITTYPRLCQVGYFVSKGASASFDGLSIRNIRTPGNVIRELDKATGKNITAVESDVIELTDPSIHSMPYFRTGIAVEKVVKSARLYATARGIYNAYINGDKVSDYYFMPGASHYDKHLMYQTYDVTEMLSAGKNTLAFILSSGWWSDMSTYDLMNYNYWGDKPSFMAKLVIEYADGSKETVVSNTDNWEYFGEGAIVFSSFFNGEHIDASRLEVDNAFLQGKEIEGVKAPVNIEPVYIEGLKAKVDFVPGWNDVNVSKPVITGSYNAPVVVNEVLTAKSVSSPAKGVYIYDFEQEMVGIPRIKVNGKAGERLYIRYGEILYPDMEKYEGLVGFMLQANLREASNIDWMILKGGEEIFEPQFTFHGYRYLEISGLSNPPEIADVQTVVLSSIKTQPERFESDHELINRLTKNISYSMKSNYLSIPTDCPQRNERMGWVGDTHAFSKTALMMGDVKNFLMRNLQAISDLQEESGRLPNVAPMGGGFGGITYESGSLIIADNIYNATGDKRVIEMTYPVMEKWMDAMLFMGMPGEAFVGPIDDWLAPEATDSKLVWNAFFGMDASLMKKFANILGKNEDALKYKEIEDATRKYWNDKFVDEDARTKQFDGSSCDSMGSYAIGLSCGMFYDKDIKKAAAHFSRHTREMGHRVMTGFFGTGPLCPMLSANGYHEDAVKLIKQTAFPSWLYPVTQGATTIWEHWDSYTTEAGFGDNNSMNSFNHYAYGSVMSWCYEYVLGIRAELPGYKSFVLEPKFEGFDKACGGIDTPYGRIESCWENGEYRCLVPANTSAKLILNGVVLEVGSGEYIYKL